MNEFNLMGYVGKEPACSITSKGKEVCSFPLQIEREFEKGAFDTVFCVAFGRVVSNILKPYIHARDRVYVSGGLWWVNYYNNKTKKNIRTLKLVVKKIYLLRSANENFDYSNVDTLIENGEEFDIEDNFED